MSKPSAHRLGLVVIVAFLLTVAVIFGQTPAPAPKPATPTSLVGTFANPAEVASHDGKLKAVVVLNDADRTVPNGGKKHLRYFQGWDYETPNVTAPANVSTFTPGPTLRARVGEKVELMFLNTVDDDNFAYTFVTDKQSATSSRTASTDPARPISTSMDSTPLPTPSATMSSSRSCR